MADAPRRPRGPGLVYAGVAAVMAVAIGAFTLTAVQQPPPTIAEFAPQAVERIEEAPTEQSSGHGSGADGECPPGVEGCEAVRPGAAPGGVPTAARIDVARTHRCVGTPPRQIEDPQSPPCVPYWDGDNGGETARYGVTADEIRVFIPTDGGQQAFFEGVRRFFNARFQLYGRQLVFVYGRNDIGTAVPETQKAEARGARDQNVFASNFYRASQGFHYHEELSRLGIVNVTGSLHPFPEPYLKTHGGFMWQYYMDSDEMLRNYGEWACKRLIGEDADHAGPGTVGEPRVIGDIVQTYYDADPTNSDEFVAELKRCGHPVPPARRIRNGVRTGGDQTSQVLGADPATATNVVLKMQQEGVTTVACTCNLFTVGALMKAATNQAYFPEWLVNTYGPSDINAAPALGAWPPEQTEHTFGITVQPRQIRRENEPYWWAAKEGDPSYSDDGTWATVGNRVELYRPMLLLASGIQMAGPNLAPDTFEQGLQRTTFPNPDHPNMAGDVGFGPNLHSMTRDAAEFWFMNNGPTPYTGSDPATVCYLNGGTRYRYRGWSSGPGAFFEPPCDSGA